MKKIFASIVFVLAISLCPFVRAHDLPGFQNLQVVTESRKLGGTYQNTTGHPIFVMVTTKSRGVATTYVTVLVNGAMVSQNPLRWLDQDTSTFMVPAGATYRVYQTSGLSLYRWIELR